MWRITAFVSVALVALLAAACGGDDGRTVACPITADTTFPPDPQPAVSLQEARERSQFGVGLPERLPPGVELESVVIGPQPGCPDEQVTMLQLAFRGEGYSFTIWELPGGPGETSGGSPIEINGVEGIVKRRDTPDWRLVTVSWASDQRGYVAFARLTGGFTEEAFLETLESIPE